MERSVNKKLYASEAPMGDLTIRQPFPSYEQEFIDPFILLHHGYMEVDKDIPPHQTGVGPHPHRGFAPVSFIYKGGIHHRDSRMNNEVIYAGGTQWMEAGMGIIHSERPALDIQEHGGELELIQLWINTPAKYKMAEPKYFPLTAENTPKINLPDGKSYISIVAGEQAGLKGPIKSYTEVNAFPFHFEKGAGYTFEIPEEHNAFVYLLDGRVKLADNDLLSGKYLAFYAKDGQTISFEATESTRGIVLTGKPLHEKIAAHGPFVMNTETQILEAMRDYRMGKMGVLIED